MRKGEQKRVVRRVAINYLRRKGYYISRTIKTGKLKDLICKQELDFARRYGQKRSPSFLYLFYLELVRRGAHVVEPRGLVYIIGNIKQGLCKIGVTAGKAENRLKSFQTGCPFDLEVLATFPGRGADFERRLHERARPYHERGEWFRIEGRLKDFLDNGNDNLYSTR